MRHGSRDTVKIKIVSIIIRLIIAQRYSGDYFLSGKIKNIQNKYMFLYF